MAAPLQPTNISGLEAHLLDKELYCLFCRDTENIFFTNFPKLKLYNSPCCLYCIKLTICSYCNDDTDIFDKVCSKCDLKLKQRFPRSTKIEKNN